MHEKCRRHSIRLRGYDYASAGAYFVTVCTKDRACLFGSVVDSKFRPNDAGRIVQDAWNAIPGRCPGARIDTFVVLPNHIHGIVILVGAGLALPDLITVPEGAAVGAGLALPNPSTVPEGAASSAPTPHTLGDIMRVFKSTSAIAVNRHLGRRGNPLWQRNFYERIIRDDTEMVHVREYIKTNPARWDTDTENPHAAVGAGLALPAMSTVPKGAASGAPTDNDNCRGAACPEQTAIAAKMKEHGHGG